MHVQICFGVRQISHAPQTPLLKKCSKKSQKTVDTALFVWDSAITHGNTNYTYMRTKTLICAATLLAAGAATSMAQNVYSLNVVGYVQVSLTNGFNLVA